MRILIDLLHIRKSFNIGTANFSFNLVVGLIQYTQWEIVLLEWDEQEEFIDQSVGFKLPKLLIPSRLKNESRLKRGLCPKMVKNVIENKGIDIILTACYTSSSYIYPAKYQQIGVIHDIQLLKIRLQNGKWFLASYIFLNMFVYYRLLRNLVAISSSVKDDIKKVCGRKSVVIYNSINSNCDNEQEIEEIKDKKYILDVNSFWEYKNTENLIRAFSRIKDTIPHFLYLKGYKSEKLRYDELMRFVKSEGCEGRVIIDINNRTSCEMNYLYNHADLFVSPSLMEGFGLTPIEAALHKIPIIVSNIKTLVEVTDGLVPTFDPKSVESISTTMAKALNFPPSKKALDKIANHFRMKYSLERQVKGYVHLIEEKTACKSN